MKKSIGKHIVMPATIGALLLTSPFVNHDSIVNSQGQGNCIANAATKIENSPFTYNASQIITEAWVKAGSAQSTNGNHCTGFTSNGSNGCYNVTGIGTTSVTVTKIGSGNTCKDISHVEYVTGTVNPTATPTSAPTTTPTSTPTSTPIQQPTTTPTAVPTSNPSHTPTERVQNTPTATPNPTTTPIDEGQDPESTPIPTQQPTATPVPTSTSNISSNSNDSGKNGTQNSSQNSSSGTPSNTQGQVLGATTLASTGSNLFLLDYASIMSGISFILYAAKKLINR